MQFFILHDQSGEGASIENFFLVAVNQIIRAEIIVLQVERYIFIIQVDRLTHAVKRSSLACAFSLPNS